MLIGQLTLTNGTSGYTDMYVGDLNSLNFMVKVISNSSMGSITLYDGYGAANDPEIPYPSVGAQPVTLKSQVTTHPAANVVFDLKGTPYTLSSLVNGQQSVSIGVQRNLGADWLSIGYPVVSADTSILIYMLGLSK